MSRRSAPDRAHEYRSLCALGFVFEDRANHLRFDADGWVRDGDSLAGGIPDIEVGCELVATAGDRLAVVRLRWSGTVVTGGPFELEHLQVVEVDEHGLLTAVLKYELDDRVGTFGEMLDRFAAGEAAGFPIATRLLRDLSHAVLTADWVAWRTTLADDFTLHDRRAAGIGTITGPDDWVEAQRVMSELSPDVALTATEVLAIADHGFIVRVRVVGTLLDGGPFENDHLDLFTIAGGGITHVELFDPEDAAAALARFQELRPPEGPAIADNLAHRASCALHRTAFTERDPDGALSFLGPAVVSDDRRSLVRTRGTPSSSSRRCATSSRSALSTWGSSCSRPPVTVSPSAPDVERR